MPGDQEEGQEGQKGEIKKGKGKLGCCGSVYYLDCGVDFTHINISQCSPDHTL